MQAAHRGGEDTKGLVIFRAPMGKGDSLPCTYLEPVPSMQLLAAELETRLVKNHTTFYLGHSTPTNRSRECLQATFSWAGLAPSEPAVRGFFVKSKNE
jgi:hypothetical protein